jgi:hypothetical protein
LIQYPSSFSHSGIGRRLLSVDELAGIFGLHSRMRMGELRLESFAALLPVGLLDCVLRPLLRSAAVCQSDGSPMLSPLLFPERSLSCRTWLPSLHLYLPHDWIIPQLVTDKAAKRDDADVPVSLWDRRITLLFPSTGPVLERFRARLLLIRGRSLYKEFLSYLHDTYGASWCSQLCQYRTTSSVSGRAPARHPGGLTMSYQSGLDLHLDCLAGIDAVAKFVTGSW